MVHHRPSYRESVSQMISWGHWFALFNILLAILLGSRYLLITNWPDTLTGRIYSWVSLAGHFSFLVFVGYLLTLFPLTFILPAQRLLRFIATIIATVGMTLLLVDSEMFTRFHLHVNTVLWELVINPDKSEPVRGWQAMFIAMPVILLIEMVFASWSWRRLRSLTRRRLYARPVVIVLFLAFITTHLMYIWADANFYRPITMQRTNLPLSYPMTARSFLAKHGLLDVKAFQQRQSEQGRSDALTVRYPLSPLNYQDSGTGYNLLLITVNELNYANFSQQMPALAQFASSNMTFTRHFSSGNQSVDGIFGLFYGISPSYTDGILATRTPSALMTALSHQGYQLGLFSADGFNSSLYRSALITDFSLPDEHQQSNTATVEQWRNWFDHDTHSQTPWFSWLMLDSTRIQPYTSAVAEVDNQIQRVLTTLQERGNLDHTVVIITAGTGKPLPEQHSNFAWSRPRLQVPLVIHWPDVPGQQITRLTDHQDVMVTLMRRLLHVSTPVNEFSQGEDLFNATAKHNWVLSASSRTLVVTTPQLTLLFDQRDGYTLYDSQGNIIKNHKLPVELLLQVLTEERRFIAD